MGCTKLGGSEPFFTERPEERCGCEERTVQRDTLMTAREAVVALICALVGGAAGGQTDGWLGALVGVFVCGCLGAIGAMMLPAATEVPTVPVDEAARAKLREALDAPLGETQGAGGLQPEATHA